MEPDLGGQLQGINLDSFLQMAQMEKSTCTLTVTRGELQGKLYVLKGELIDAETGEWSGYDAACRIVSWKDTLIEIENRCEKRKKAVERPLMDILMEGSRIREEAEAQEAPASGGAEAEEGAEDEDIPLELDSIEIEPLAMEDKEAPLDMDAVEIEPLAAEDEDDLFDFVDDDGEAGTGGEATDAAPPAEEDEPLGLDMEEMALDLDDGGPQPEGGQAPAAQEGKEPEKPKKKAKKPSADKKAGKKKPAKKKAPARKAPEPEPPAAEPLEEFKDLSRPAERIEREAPSEEKGGLRAVAPPPPPKKMSKKVVGLAAGLAVVVGVVVYFLFIADPTKSDYEDTLAQVEGQASPAGRIRLLEAFVQRHEPGEYTEQARAQIQALRMQLAQQAFEAFSAKVAELPVDDDYAATVTSLGEAFLAEYPEGPLAQEVRRTLSDAPGRVDDVDFAKVKGAQLKDFDEKIAACNWYLEKHPDGKHRQEVQRILRQMSQSFYAYLQKEVQRCDEQGAWDKCIQLTQDFITAFRNDPRLEEVVGLKVRMQGQQALQALLREAGQKGDAYGEAKAVFEAFLAENPGSVHADRVRSEIRGLEEKIQEREDWEALAAFADDRSRDVFERLDRLEAYVKSNPDSPFAAAARKRIAALDTEKREAVARQQQAAERQRQQAVEQARQEKIRQERQRIEQMRQKAAAAVAGSGGRYVANNANGTVTDTASGLMWTLLDSHLHLGKCLNYPSALNYVKGLDAGGYRNWRLPTSGELAGIYKNRPFFPQTGAAWYWSSEAYVKGYHSVANTVSAKQETAFNIGQQRQDACGAVRAVRP